MARKSKKLPGNITGSYYVDDQCIACDACVVEAPKFFAMNDEKGHAFVFKQPITDIELKDCEAALASCPVEAIGRDG